jgi:hypothetical protein
MIMVTAIAFFWSNMANPAILYSHEPWRLAGVPSRFFRISLFENREREKISTWKNLFTEPPAKYQVL